MNPLFRLSPRTFVAVAVTLITPATVAAVGCSGNDTSSVETSSGEAGGSTPTVAASSTSAASTTGTASSTSTVSSTSSSVTSGSGGGGASSSSSGSGGGTGGAGGGSGGAWPTCDAPPLNVPMKTLNQIWIDNPSQATAAWVPGVFVTAISLGGCVAGAPCQIFVQQAESFANLAAGSQQALKLFVSANAAHYFTSIKVADKVDIYASAIRDPMTNELLLEVNLGLEGCAKTVGTGLPVPVVVTLDDLSIDAYENTVGPLFVEVDGVSGKPQTPPEIFALWTTGNFADAGLDTVTNLSPYFLVGDAFSGLVAGKIHDFTFIKGVFGVVPLGNPAVKYEVLYPRVMANDVKILKVH